MGQVGPLKYYLMISLSLNCCVTFKTLIYKIKAPFRIKKEKRNVSNLPVNHDLFAISLTKNKLRTFFKRILKEY